MPGSLSFLVSALLAGAAVPFQSGANAMLGRLLGHPLWATLVSLGVSAVLIVPVMAVFRVPVPSSEWRSRGHGGFGSAVPWA
nr:MULTISPECIES: DMT family transporter [unclassified Mesorhizobium]